jgi:hypothetical protein
MVMRKPFNIRLDQILVREAKKRAIDNGVHLYEFIEEALRRALDGQDESNGGRAKHDKTRGQSTKKPND